VKPVPVDVVTGFLGAGKTTLLRHVLAGALAGERVAVVMNEIGDVSIDGRIVRGLEHVESMVELDSGCVCCSIDDLRFDAAVLEIVEKTDPTLIILETTGTADPEPLRARLERAGLPLDAIITVVDAENADRMLGETAVAGAQIRAADFLILNKIDLVDALSRARLRRRIGRLNRRAVVMECERSSVPAEVLFATAARRYRDDTRASQAVQAPTVEAAGGRDGPPGGHGEGDDRISAFTWRGDQLLDQARFERFLRRLPPSIYRAKGFVRFREGDWPCLFNYTCGRYELNWIQLGRFSGPAEAVFIGRAVEQTRGAILQALEDCRTR
jgi:cobalamin biosynthesis protein CobW